MDEILSLKAGGAIRGLDRDLHPEVSPREARFSTEPCPTSLARGRGRGAIQIDRYFISRKPRPTMGSFTCLLLARREGEGIIK
jgi:hypothetical protein